MVGSSRAAASLALWIGSSAAEGDADDARLLRIDATMLGRRKPPVEDGHGPGKEVVNGRTVAREDLPPYLASMGRGESSHMCGATLIGPRTVLTAAHCFTCPRPGIECGDAGNFFGFSEWIDFNRYDLSEGLEGVDRREICGTEGAAGCAGRSYVVRDPRYELDTFRYDFALIFLNEPVGGNNTPVALNRDEKVPSGFDRLDVYGWGSISSDEFVPPDRPHTTDVFYVPNMNCRGGNPFEYPESWITHDMLCAWDYGSNACRGDSGGPIVVEKPGGHVQVGVISWHHESCVAVQYPSVYARVSARLDWITETACRENGDLCKKGKSGRGGNRGKRGTSGKGGKKDEKGKWGNSGFDGTEMQFDHAI